MILKGNQRASGRELALHLLNVEDNEHAVVHELRGFMSDYLIEAFKEIEAISLGTKCQQYLFSLSLNPPKTAKVSIADFEKVIGEVERRMGLSGQSTEHKSKVADQVLKQREEHQALPQTQETQRIEEIVTYGKNLGDELFMVSGLITLDKLGIVERYIYGLSSE